MVQSLNFGMVRTLGVDLEDVLIGLFSLWEEVLGIASSIALYDEEDEPVWQFYSSGVYFQNLEKRIVVDDHTCLFCKEKEYVAHLFFDCVVATWVWLLMLVLLII
jgi:hypothetical protein